jgi:cytochrome c peroxidase
MASVARSFARAAAFKSTPSTSAFRASVRRTAFYFSCQNFGEQARRGYASEPAKSSSSTLLYGALGLFIAGSGGVFFYNQNASATATVAAAATEEKPFVPGPEDYQKVYDALAALLADRDEYEDGSYGPILIRLAWHASGTYDKETGTGGSNGATMRFSPEGGHLANTGLNTARNFLEQIKGTFFVCYPSSGLNPNNLRQPSSHGSVTPTCGFWLPSALSKRCKAQLFHSEAVASMPMRRLAHPMDACQMERGIKNT